MRAGVIFDLDDTLIADAEVNAASLSQVAAWAGLPGRVAGEVLRHAEGLWREGPQFDLCDRVGISAVEGLWGRFGSYPRLGGWVGAYQRESWARVLGGERPSSAPSADALAARFRLVRSGRHEVYPEVAAKLEELRGHQLALGLLTNGDPDLQREKIIGSGLSRFFDTVVISGDRILRGEVGRGKPDPSIFDLVMNEMGVDRAVMVGDKVSRDIEGARAAGVGALLIRRPGVDPARFRGAGDTPQITSLNELTLGRLPRLLGAPRSRDGERTRVATAVVRERDRDL